MKNVSLIHNSLKVNSDNTTGTNAGFLKGNL